MASASIVANTAINGHSSGCDQAYRLLQNNIHNLEMKLRAKADLLNGFRSVALTQSKQISFMQTPLAGRHLPGWPMCHVILLLVVPVPSLDTVTTLPWPLTNDIGIEVKTDVCEESLKVVVKTQVLRRV